MSKRSLRVDADLSLEVDGSPVRLTGSGQLLELVAERPRDLRTAMARSPFAGSALRPGGPLRMVADGLADAGLTVRVSDVGGATLATVGAGVDSSVGRLVTGSRAFRPGSASAVVPLLLPPAWPGAVAVALALALAVAGAVALGRRLRH